MSRRRNTLLTAIELALEQYPGLGLGKLRALLYVAENPGLSISELSDLCGCSLATTSRTIRALAGPDIDYSLSPSLGWVELGRAADDPRIVTVRLSVSGAALCGAIDRVISEPKTIF